jgi:hypothetical protein
LRSALIIASGILLAGCTSSAVPAPQVATPHTFDVPSAGSGVAPSARRTLKGVYVTGYTWFDNTPPGSGDISHPIIHQKAGGTGTYSDPITLAVGHSIAHGRDVLDFAPGTRFYVSHLHRYFIVEDTCGDGGSPQHGPCHDLSKAPPHATAWIDVYVGGSAQDSRAQVQECAQKVNGPAELHDVLQGPPAGLPVVPGPLFRHGDQGGSCGR